MCKYSLDYRTLGESVAKDSKMNVIAFWFHYCYTVYMMWSKDNHIFAIILLNNDDNNNNHNKIDNKNPFY